MKILSAEQIKEADKFTIQQEPVSSIDLMERAARSCLFRILKHSDDDTSFVIFCGTKNNGGDGLAIARMLAERNLPVQVVIVHFSSTESEDFKENLKRLTEQNKTTISHIHSAEEIKSVDLNGKVVIDALIGTGISKKAEGLLSDTIEHINNAHAYVIAIDVPSGMIPDANNDKNTIVRANKTLSFQTPKFAFFFPENYAYCGSFDLLDIGLDQDFISQQRVGNYFVTKEFIPQLLLHRERIAHKGNFGSALLICGSHGKMGAAQLAASACLRSGAGLLTVHVPKCGYTIMQTSLPETMVSCSADENFIDTLPELGNYSAIGIGCGIGTDKQTQNIVKLLIQNSPKPLVIDADALNILAENKTWLSFLPKYSILTPHPKEFDRIAGAHTSSYQRLNSARELAIKHGIIIVLKGMFTACVMPDGDIFFNSTGNPGMAKGGSGDTLTGIITGLLARGYPPNYAAILGVYLHGFAADIALKKNHVESLLASDVIAKIPKAFEKMYS